jgi:hypothetical protein
MKLIDERTPDGSRHFARFPHAVSWKNMCEHVLRLQGSEMLNFVGNGLANVWLDFHFRQHRFLIDVDDGHFRLFVRDPQCPDLILCQVGYHFEQLFDGEKPDERDDALAS